MTNYLNSKNLSLKSVGLLSKVFSQSDDWVCSMSALSSICVERTTAIKSALDELKEWGYLDVKKMMPNETASGHMEYFYVFRECSDKDKER